MPLREAGRRECVGHAVLALASLRVPAAHEKAAQDPLGGATAAAAELLERLADGLRDVAREVFTLGIHVGALLSAVLTAATAVVAAKLE